jgi:hypothetical protein
MIFLKTFVVFVWKNRIYRIPVCCQSTVAEDGRQVKSCIYWMQSNNLVCSKLKIKKKNKDLISIHSGYGNWEDISKHIETRSPEDAKVEYINKFLNGTNW